MIRAKDAPGGAIVRASTGSEYVRCYRADCLMRWGQPIPGSGEWLVDIVGQLPPGEDLTRQEKREVAEAQQRMVS